MAAVDGSDFAAVSIKGREGMNMVAVGNIALQWMVQIWLQ